jgi:hypothetical protein
VLMADSLLVDDGPTTALVDRLASSCVVQGGLSVNATPHLGYDTVGSPGVLALLQARPAVPFRPKRCSEPGTRRVLR